MSQMLIAILYHALAIACWFYALRFGGSTALWAFIPFACAFVGTLLATPWTQIDPNQHADPWHGLNIPLLLSDAFFLIGITIVALKSKFYWPIWSAGFALLTVLSHAGPIFDHFTNPKLYRGLETIWALPALLTMVLGIARDRKAGPHGSRTSTEQKRS